MTATLVEAPRVTSVVRELRADVRRRLEREYLRLRLTRPAARPDLVEAREEIDAEWVRTLAVTDYRLAAISDFLRARHEPHPDTPVCRDCCVLLDRGEGPQWVVLAALAGGDLPLVAADSALGRALIGARPGDLVHYPDPSGLQTARVIALESGEHF